MLSQIKIAAAAAAAVYLTGCSDDGACDGQKWQASVNGTCTGIPCSGPAGDYSDVDCADLGNSSSPAYDDVLCRDSDGNPIDMSDDSSEEGTCERPSSPCDGDCATKDNVNNPYQDDVAFCVAPASGDTAADCTGNTCTGGDTVGICGNDLADATQTLYCVSTANGAVGTEVASGEDGKCAAGITAYDTDADAGKMPASCTADGDECSAYTKVGDTIVYSSCSCAVGSVGLDSATAFSADSGNGVCVCIPVDDSEN